MKIEEMKKDICEFCKIMAKAIFVFICVLFVFFLPFIISKCVIYIPHVEMVELLWSLLLWGFTGYEAVKEANKKEGDEE